MLLNTAAVIVTYNPDRIQLSALIDTLVSSIEHVIIVDNNSSSDVYELISPFAPNFSLLRQSTNSGIACALNIGINYAKTLDSDYVYLFDQDSSPSCHSINQLMYSFQSLSLRIDNLACIGPMYIDRRQKNQSNFYRIEGLRLKRYNLSPEDDPIPVDHLITSGCLFEIAVFEKVGLMNESLFIDYVDIEWCERAISKGAQPYGDPGSFMNHNLGDSPIFLFGTPYPVRSPLRHYYMVRNAIWMYKQTFVRLEWKIVDALRLFRRVVFYSIFAKPQKEHIFMMIKGFWHGLFGKKGCYKR